MVSTFFRRGHPSIRFVVAVATIPTIVLVMESIMHNDCDCPPRRGRAKMFLSGIAGGTVSGFISKIDAGMVFDITMMVVG